MLTDRRKKFHMVLICQRAGIRPEIAGQQCGENTSGSVPDTRNRLTQVQWCNSFGKPHVETLGNGWAMEPLIIVARLLSFFLCAEVSVLDSGESVHLFHSWNPIKDQRSIIRWSVKGTWSQSKKSFETRMGSSKTVQS